MKHDLGDGPACPEEGGHGKTYSDAKTGRLWCPVSQAIFAPATYDEDGRAFVTGKILRAGYLRPAVKHVFVQAPDEQLAGDDLSIDATLLEA